MTDKPNTANTCPFCGHQDTHTPMIGCLHADGTTFCDCMATWAAPKTLDTARKERDRAMVQVGQASDSTWVREAATVIRDLATAGVGPFSADDVWNNLEAKGITAPREPRALGPVLKRLTQAQVIQPEGYVPSVRRHCAPVRSYVAGPKS